MDIGKILNGGPEGKWYSVPEADKVRVKIKNVKPSRRREIVKQCTRKRVIKGQYVTELNDDRLADILLKECVVEWEGIEHEGEPFPCNDDNKRILDENWPQFNSLWNVVIGELNSMDTAFEENELGN